MLIAGAMLAHQVAAKAVRDTFFLSAWPAERLPAMVFATALLVVAAVPVFSRLLGRFSPRVVVPVGFLISSAGHLVEWRLLGTSPWIAVVIYLHVAGLGALLLSGFWSHVSELFDPQTAKKTYGRIAAAGTLGGLGGGLAAERIAATMTGDAALLFLAGVHFVCAGAMWLLAAVSRPVRSGEAPEAPGRLFSFGALRAAPHLKTLAVLIVVTTAGAAVVDYVLKAQAAETFPTENELLRFFAVFYSAISIVTFLAQTGVGPAVRRLGLGRTVSSLPLGLGSTSALAMVFQTFGMVAVARGVEAVLRGSLFRSGYELLFVPMDPDEKRRTKTFLDVTCDRGGDALGAMIVQASLLLVAPAFLNAQLLAAVVAMAIVALWLGKRLDAVYVGVVERRLVGQVAVAPAVIGSETGWTIVDVPLNVRRERAEAAAVAEQTPPEVRDLDPRLRVLADLTSGDRARVEHALAGLKRPDTTQVAAVVPLLAWDDVVAGARRVLEHHADSHVGLLLDALLEPDTDFAIRRRIPRILGTLASQRTLDGLVLGLDDPRFEVRYRCGRAIDRLLVRNGALVVNRKRLMAVVERELSVPAQVWRGHQLIDRDDPDDSGVTVLPDRAQKNIEHIFSLLAGILPRDPLEVAMNGIFSEDPQLRGLAREYLDSVLPDAITTRLWKILDHG